MTKTRRRKNEEKKIDYGVVVTGNYRIFSKDKTIGQGKDAFTVTDYWFSFGQKNEKGEWFNRSMRVYFGKDDDRPEHNSLISFMGRLFLSGNEDFNQIAILIEEWDYIE